MNGKTSVCARAARFACVAAAALGAPAHGAVTVSTTPTSGPTYTLTPVGGKTRIALATSVTTQPTSFLIRADAADMIETITVSAFVNQTVFVEVRGNTSTTSTLASIDAIDKGGSTATIVVSNTRTSGDVGSIFVNTITGLHVGGDLTGGIVLAPRTSGESSLISATVGGRIRGDVLVDHGAIFDLTALGGIGAPGAPVRVRTRDTIHRLVASEIFADITTLSGGGTGWLGTLRTTAGPLVGSLSAGAIADSGSGQPGLLSVAGNLDADVNIIGSVRNQNGGQPVVVIGGGLPAGRTFRIGTSLESGAQFIIGAPGGLAGQVIVNGWGTTGQWAGTVTVGSTTLTPAPGYSALSGPLGGGSAGRVPFMLHASDSWPAAGSVLAGASGPAPSNPVRMRYYGPVSWSSGSGTPMVVESRPVGSSGPWADETGCFVAAREPGLSPSANVVALYPVRTLPGGRIYRVRAVRTGPGALYCDVGLASNPPVAEEAGDFTFIISGGCTGDVDGNGVVNFADVSMLLASWGGSGGSCLTSADVNGDGLINFGDITVVLANWDAQCP
jgi:hypothetical protein